MKNMLRIVGCTHKKIWDAERTNTPDYVPAKHVYKGRGFLKAITHIDGPWVILSAKYGFIEPDHPICRYDIVLGSPGSISDETLKAQVYQTRFWRSEYRLGKLTAPNIVEVRLKSFPHVLILNCNKTYVEKVHMCFSDAQIHP